MSVRLNFERDNPDLYVMRARLNQLDNKMTAAYHDVNQALSLNPIHKVRIVLWRCRRWSSQLYSISTFPALTLCFGPFTLSANSNLLCIADTVGAGLINFPQLFLLNPPPLGGPTHCILPAVTRIQSYAPVLRNGATRTDRHCTQQDHSCYQVWPFSSTLTSLEARHRAQQDHSHFQVQPFSSTLSCH